MILRQSTAVVLRVGVFADVADGFTGLTGLASQNGRYVKGGAGAAFTPSSWAHDGGGFYLVGLSTTHTDTVGPLAIQWYDAATYLPVWVECQVVEEAIYDTLFASGATAPATAASIAALNNLSSAEAQSAAAAALTAYDPPTHAELTSGFAAADDAVLAAIAALSIPSAAAVASAVWSAVTRTLTSSGALSQDDIDDIVAAVVAAITAAAQSDSITTDGTTVTRRRGDSWTVAFTGLGSIANRTKLWLTIKRDPSHTDAVAELAVTEAGGLITLAGDAIASPITSADGDLEVTDAAAGNVTLTVAAAATALLEAAGGRFYDLQVLRSTGAVETLTSGRWAVVSDVTRATS